MIFIILYVFPGLTGVGRTLKVNATLHLAYLVSQSQPKSTQLCSNTVIIGWSHTDTHTRETCPALMNIHSALYWGQRNAPFNFIFEKINFEQKSQFREQVFTSMTGRTFCYYFYCVYMCLCVCTDRCLSHISRT